MPDFNITTKVSIIMPTYNRADLIMETIESIRSQSYPYWELIIMDDGSEDNTEALIRQIEDDRIQFHKAGRTGMVSKLKNSGIRKATSELIAFADSDDLWAPNKLEKQVTALAQYPRAGFCLTGGYDFIKHGQPIKYYYKEREGIMSGDIFTSLFRSEIAVLSPTLLLHKKCIEVSDLFDEAKPFSDPDFIVSLASHFETVIIFEPLLYRRLHDTNDSDEHWEKRFQEWVVVIQSYRKKNRLPVAVARDSLFRLYINFGEKCLAKKKRIKAINCFSKAWKNKLFSIVPFKKTCKAILYSLKK